MERSDVLAIGPGLGRDEWGRRLFDYANQSSLPAVVDADGLRCLAATGHRTPAGARVLTPHVGEAAALLAQSGGEVALDRTRAARTIASTYGAVVVMKGAHSVVANADGQFGICAQGNPGMATAGSGDVLTGIAAGIWAQQKTPENSAYALARAAVFVHARAGDLAALDGERGLMASDIVGHVRACVNFN
jgi:NAD(P)H-hydrate epimerase